MVESLLPVYEANTQFFIYLLSTFCYYSHHLCYYGNYFDVSYLQESIGTYKI